MMTYNQFKDKVDEEMGKYPTLFFMRKQGKASQDFQNPNNNVYAILAESIDSETLTEEHWVFAKLWLSDEITTYKFDSVEKAIDGFHEI